MEPRRILPGAERPDQPAAVGAFVAVVGPSGAGKDTLLNYARRELAGNERIQFVRRVITRPSDGETERHIPATVSEFDAMKEAGEFAATWRAHDLQYGLPVETEMQIRAGQTVVCNGSRAALEVLQSRFMKFAVISITARRDVLANRLAARGRESREQILKRLDRSAAFDADRYEALQIDNSDTVAIGGAALVAAIRALGSGQKP